MDQRPRNGSEPSEPPPAEAVSPDEPGSVPPTPAPLPWERPSAPTEPPPAPRSTIISADPVLSADDAASRPEVEWAPPPPADRLGVPGVPGFVFGSVLARFAAWWIDGFILFVAGAVLAGVAEATLSMERERDAAALTAIFYLIVTALSVVYFVGFWTSSWQTTPGMRVFQLRVGTAFDGRPLSVVQSLPRWALLGYPLGLLVLVPEVAIVASLFVLVLPVVLLISTVSSPTRQGIHDRVARSMVTQPAGGTRGRARACLVIVIGILVVWFLAVALLIFMGGQIAEILREAGQPS